MLKIGSLVYNYNNITDKVETGVITDIFIDNMDSANKLFKAMVSITSLTEDKDKGVKEYTFPVSELKTWVDSDTYSHPAFFDTYEEAEADKLPF